MSEEARKCCAKKPIFPGPCWSRATGLHGGRSESQPPLLKQLFERLFQSLVRSLKPFNHLCCPLEVLLDSMF